MHRRHLSLTVFLILGTASSLLAGREILNASIDVSRELFSALNPKFIAEWQQQKGETIAVKQSHQGSSKQARSILEGLPADVVTFNQVSDVQVLCDEGKLITADWEKRLPNESSPYYSLTSFLVRKGNPKQIKDWSDLARDDVSIVFPNPKTSGNARYTYLAAWAYGLRKFNGDEGKTREFVGKILRHVAVFDTGGRGATTTFVEREIGDVLITFESETQSIRKEYTASHYEVITPSVSIAGLFPVAVVDKVVDKRGTRDIAEAYLKFLYTEPAQEIIAQNFYRVRSPEIAKKYAAQFPEIELLNANAVFGSWEEIRTKHFANGAIFDQLLKLP